MRVEPWMLGCGTYEAYKVSPKGLVCCSVGIWHHMNTCGGTGIACVKGTFLESVFDRRGSSSKLGFQITGLVGKTLGRRKLQSGAPTARRCRVLGFLPLVDKINQGVLWPPETLGSEW